MNPGLQVLDFKKARGFPPRKRTKIDSHTAQRSELSFKCRPGCPTEAEVLFVPARDGLQCLGLSE